MTGFEPDNGRTGFARDVFRVRRSIGRWPGLTQKQFAERYGITVGMLKDVEQGRVEPSRALKVLVAAVDLNPTLMAKAAIAAAERWPE